ncbi:MAG: Gfo/Idh/MocA family oxidoreductase [Alsobacter sp.]
MAAIRIGVIGLGKIAQDQHLPVIAKNPEFKLVAVTSQRGLGAPGANTYATATAMYDREPEIDAVAICTPPQVRHALAKEALLAGKHVMLEKPPAATTSELVDLERIARGAGKVLFTTWHSQYNQAVDEAKARLSGQVVTRLQVTWKEDVRHWHPGQAWIWEAGGFGVFDPGINALSIVTKIMPEPIFVTKADLETPANKDAPIAAQLSFSNGRKDSRLAAVFDWRQTGPQTWDIDIETQAGPRLTLTHGGSKLLVDGSLMIEEKPEEYERIYDRFAELVRTNTSEVDHDPFRLVADAFLLGRRVETDAFED